MKSDRIYMPHAGHFCGSDDCRFHLNTYVNGYIVSTIGEYWPPVDVRRIFATFRSIRPKSSIDENGKVCEKLPLTEEQRDKLLSLKGDAFDSAYLHIFGYEQIGLNRIYETMVFRAIPSPETPCCPWKMQSGSDLDFVGYDNARDAYEGHLTMCSKWEEEVHSTLYQEKDGLENES